MKATEELANRIWEARQKRRQIAPVSRLAIGLDAAEAYYIQRLNVNRRLLEGDMVLGRKIGLTSKCVQEQFGVTQPDFGLLFQSMEAKEGDTIPFDAFMQPRVEAEIAFHLSDTISEIGLGVDAVVERVASATVAIEVVDSAIENWNVALFDTIADNASVGMFVLSEKTKRLDEFDRLSCRMVMRKEGVVVSEGVGASSLGDPLHALQWLADAAIRAGEPLKKGEVVLSGALGPMVEVSPSDRYTVEIDGLGSLEVAFSAASAEQQEPRSMQRSGEVE